MKGSEIRGRGGRDHVRGLFWTSPVTYKYNVVIVIVIVISISHSGYNSLFRSLLVVLVSERRKAVKWKLVWETMYRKTNLPFSSLRIIQNSLEAGTIWNISLILTLMGVNVVLYDIFFTLVKIKKKSRKPQ